MYRLLSPISVVAVGLSRPSTSKITNQAIQLGRPRILPLPDDQASHVMQGMEVLREQIDVNPPARNKRHIWEQLVEIVYEATGQVYGHQTYREMLRIYGKAWGRQEGEANEWRHWPGTTAMQASIEVVRQRLKNSIARALETDPGIPVKSPIRRPPAIPSTIAHLHVVDEGSDREMERFLRIEIEELRSGLALERVRANDAAAGKERTVQDAREIQSRLETVQTAYTEQKIMNQQLTDAIERMQAQSDASHRYSLMQIDKVRSETRQAHEELISLKHQLSAAQRMLTNERTIVDNYRRQLSDLRNRRQEAK